MSASALTVLASAPINNKGLYEHVGQRHVDLGRSLDQVFTFAGVAHAQANVCNVRLCRHSNSYYKQEKDV